jgi:hypothetical protein
MEWSHKHPGQSRREMNRKYLFEPVAVMANDTE